MNRCAFPLCFRVPAWCTRGQIAVNGLPVSPEPDARGFVRIHRHWVEGDTVVLTFPMLVRVARGFETEYPASTRKYFASKPDVLFQKRRLPYESFLAANQTKYAGRLVAVGDCLGSGWVG
jgi:hypothetical protein